jgi:hypothetical protein
MKTRFKKHQHHICLEHPDKSAMAKHSISLGHSIHLQNTTILSTKSRCMDQMIREAIGIVPHCNNMKMGGWPLPEVVLEAPHPLP